MPYIVYINYSLALDQYYIGHTENIQDRLFRHNNSGSRSTKKANDRRLVYTQQFESKSAANQRELGIKRKKSRKYVE
jgi:putative endonuclease